MEKLVIKIIVYKEVDPDLYDSVGHLPLRQRAAVIRRLWREGLRAGHVGTERSPMANTPGAHSTADIPMPGPDLGEPRAPATDLDSAKALLSDDFADLLKGSTMVAT